MARPARITVGSREAKTRFGTYLDLARHGTIVTVTDHGRPVAQLTPLPAADDDVAPALRKMADDGLLRLPTLQPRRAEEWPEPIEVTGVSLSQAVILDRADRF